jgi:Zn-dependent protease
MFRILDPGIVLFRQPVPVTIGPGGPFLMLAFGALFAAFAAGVGLPIPAAAVLGAVGGTVSLIVHELGHVRAAAKLTGIQPIGISVIWLGAATRLEGTYASGRDQARVAIAGPRASLGLALVISPLMFTPIPPLARELLLTLVLLNLAIATLNLIPVSPLDGYKVIVGLVWSMIGTESAARRLIRRVGSAWMLVELAGVCVLLATRPLVGSVSLLIGAGFYGQKLFVRRARA